jgi:RNA polymerase sigma-70 factor, ECF subfamily
MAFAPLRARRDSGAQNPVGAPQFDDVYQAHAQTVARWLSRLSGPGADVEDLTQEVFVVVARRLREYRADSQISTWLFAIAARIAANDRRRRRIRRLWMRLRPSLDDRARPGDATPSDVLEQRERRDRLYETLGRLSERQRRAFVLFELEEMSIAEVAQLMRLTLGNVRVLLHRARASFLRHAAASDDERREAKEIRNAVRT